MNTYEKNLLKQPVNEAALAGSICRDDFYFFLTEFWDVVIKEEPVFNWHIKFLCDTLQEIVERVIRRESALWDYVIINVPPGSTKSTIATQFLPIWSWTADASLRWICSSYSADVSLDHGDKSRLIFRSEKFARYFPELLPDRDNDAKSDFKNLLGGERYATSTGANITGNHAHVIVVDDPLNPKGAVSDADRKSANKYVDETLFSRKVDKKIVPTIIIMQRLHEDDVTGHVLKKPGLRVLHICLPAELSNNIQPAELRKEYERQGGLLDPIRLDRDVLKTMRTVLGTYAASGQLDQRPSPEEGGILKKRWFEIVDRVVPAHAPVKFRIDPAYTEKTSNDATGFLAYFMEGGILYVVNAEELFLELPELTAYLKVYYQRHGGDHRSTMKVEPKASGKSVVQSLKTIKGFNIMEGRAPKEDKIARVNSISPSCEAGKVKLLRGSWNEYFLGQLGAFPNASQDNLVDCLAEAVLDDIVLDRSGYGYKKRN